MQRCAICGETAFYTVTPYTGTTAGTAVQYCEAHTLDKPTEDTTKTYKIERLPYTYERAFIGRKASGGYVK